MEGHADLREREKLQQLEKQSLSDTCMLKNSNEE
jgi:hypothetical protein